MLWKWNSVAFNLIYLLEMFKSTALWLLYAFLCFFAYLLNPIEPICIEIIGIIPVCYLLTAAEISTQICCKICINHLSQQILEESNTLLTVQKQMFASKQHNLGESIGCQVHKITVQTTPWLLFNAIFAFSCVNVLL